MVEANGPFENQTFLTIWILDNHSVWYSDESGIRVFRIRMVGLVDCQTLPQTSEYIFDPTFCSCKIKASLLNQIKMTENRLEFDRIKMTTTNVNVRTWPKLYNDEQ